jgi:hypothetical protein
MKIHEIHDTGNADVIAILEQGLSAATDPVYIKNYHPSYRDNPANLFYVLNTGRFRQGHGKYFVITDDQDKYMCSLGWNEYDLDPTVALVLARMYIAPEFRGQYIIGKHVLPKVLQEASRYDRIWITANEHNKTIYNYFERANSGKRTTLFNDWPEIYKRFKPIGKHMVYYTPQWVAEYTKENT